MQQHCEVVVVRARDEIRCQRRLGGKPGTAAGEHIVEGDDRVSAVIDMVALNIAA